MSITISKYGGDIIQFFGHSLIAIWPRFVKDEESDEEEEIQISQFKNDLNDNTTKMDFLESDSEVCRKSL
jgi:hypothetical protein